MRAFLLKITIFAVFPASVVVFDDEHLCSFLHTEVVPRAEADVVYLADLHRYLFSRLADIERGFAFEQDEHLVGLHMAFHKGNFALDPLVARIRHRNSPRAEGDEGMVSRKRVELNRLCRTDFPDNYSSFLVNINI